MEDFVEEFELKINYSKIGKQFPTRDNQWGYLPEYELTDAEISYRYKKNDRWNLKSYLKANNVFDEKYEIFMLIPKPGFNCHAGISIQFDL